VRLPAAVGVGIAAGAVARLVQQATLEQKVPFTLRKHTLLLPVFAELLLGQFSFAQVCAHNVWLCHVSHLSPLQSQVLPV
jgi:fluoride ion exporter CrcB/FEX